MSLLAPADQDRLRAEFAGLAHPVRVLFFSQTFDSGLCDEARRILTSRRDKLEAVTRRLLEKEVMEGDELRQILDVALPPADPLEGATPLPVVTD